MTKNVKTYVNLGSPRPTAVNRRPTTRTLDDTKPPMTAQGSVTIGNWHAILTLGVDFVYEKTRKHFLSFVNDFPDKNQLFRSSGMTITRRAPAYPTQESTSICPDSGLLALNYESPNNSTE